MVIMALDHVRDFIHRGAMSFSATDLSKTTSVLFLTRWITHICLPVFVFTAGAGAYLWWRQRNHTKGELSRFLWTRGLWFILLELTVLQFAYNFNFSKQNLILLLVLWIFGICFLLFSVLIYLPLPILLTVSALIAAGHNLLDGIPAAKFGALAPFWNLLHQPGLIVVAGRQVLVTYTILPWIGVMGLGFWFGQVLMWDQVRRRRAMVSMGLGAIAAFVVLRGINRYGDPAPWSSQSSAMFTMLSFLNCTKYPGSLDFLFMTLGPGMLILAALDRYHFSSRNPMIVFGRVPMFFFILHLYVIHALDIALALTRYGGRAFAFMFNPVPSMGGPANLFPADFGWRLALVYVLWAALVAALYPICRWFAERKARGRGWWWSYL